MADTKFPWPTPADARGGIEPLTSDAADEVADDLDNAHHMLEVLSWVEDARQVIQGVQLAAEIDKTLHDRLREFDVRFGLSWEDYHSTGLAMILIEAKRSIGEATQVLRTMASSVRNSAQGSAS